MKTKEEILEKYYRNYKKRIAYDENVLAAMDEYAQEVVKNNAVLPHVSGSALIADFMGIKEIESSYDSYGMPKPIWYAGYCGYRTPAFNVPGKSIEHLLNENKFNNSWDWLMPVIEKIEIDCKHEVHIFGHYNWKKPNRCLITDWRNNEICHTSNDSKFQCVFDAVVEFIKWWNASQADR